MTLYQQALIALISIVVFKLYLIHHDVLEHDLRVDFWSAAVFMIGCWAWLGYTIEAAIW